MWCVIYRSGQINGLYYTEAVGVAYDMERRGEKDVDIRKL